ncbi:MAG TPA: hypothetical protein VKD26_01185 [Streptosporangiaceae bacterium]|nr:hypothetical protein [Streptosporangiaceae bacterium]
MTAVKLDPEPQAELDRLDKAGAFDLHDRIDEAIASSLPILVASAAVSERSAMVHTGYPSGTGTRTGSSSESPIPENDVIAVRFIGVDPFA